MINENNKIELIYNYSPDELRVLRQCSIEAFLYRALPLSMIFGFGSAMLMRRSLREKRLFSHIFVLMNSLFGFYIGNVSYAPICVERLMNLPHSELGAIIRSKKDIKNTDADRQEAVQLAPFKSKTDAYTDEAYDSNMK